jgi:hypothetical protein
VDVGRRWFLGGALVAVLGALSAGVLRWGGGVAALRRRASEALRPRLDATTGTGPLAAATSDALLAFGEVVVAGEPLAGEGREALRAALAEAAETQAGYRALCEAAAGLLDRLAGGAFAARPLAERTALVAAHRLGEHPASRGALLFQDRVAVAMRDFLVPDLVTAYWGSPAGWAAVGYRRPYGECGDPRAYTRRPA